MVKYFSGATNFPQSLDAALTRPGRFDSKVTVGFPDRKGRVEILKLYLSKVKMGENVDLNLLAQKLIGNFLKSIDLIEILCKIVPIIMLY